ncbi:hypothetical protein PG994_014542 [Apiospora phragmitis]|uniref:DUF3329 domain-containing protein n=1 Tax=Apiospora phragmitis TaxID=2905665 RepID=A0ABR1T4K3_9PEZI
MAETPTSTTVAPAPTSIWTPVAPAGNNVLGVALWAQWGATLQAWPVLIPWLFLGLWGVLTRNLLRHDCFRDWVARWRLFDEADKAAKRALEIKAAKKAAAAAGAADENAYAPPAPAAPASAAARRASWATVGEKA